MTAGGPPLHKEVTHTTIQRAITLVTQGPGPGPENHLKGFSMVAVMMCGWME